MNLDKELANIISNNCGFVCITGAGGKTSLMQLLASYYKGIGKTVLMTTTTKIQSPEVYKWNCDKVFTDAESVMAFEPNKPCSILYANSYSDEKLCSPTLEVLKMLKEKYEVVLCEADGAKQMPIKWHTSKDPVVPNFTTFTIAVMGAWGKVESMQNYIDDSQGLLKGTLKDKRAVLINGWNQYPIMFSNIQWPLDCDILLASVIENELYKRN